MLIGFIRLWGFGLRCVGLQRLALLSTLNEVELLLDRQIFMWSCLHEELNTVPLVYNRWHFCSTCLLLSPLLHLSSLQSNS